MIWSACTSSIWPLSTSRRNTQSSTSGLLCSTLRARNFQRSQVTWRSVSRCKAPVMSRFSSMTRLDLILQVRSSWCLRRLRKNSSSWRLDSLQLKNCQKWTLLAPSMPISMASSMERRFVPSQLQPGMNFVLLSRNFGCQFSGHSPLIAFCSSSTTKIQLWTQ